MDKFEVRDIENCYVCSEYMGPFKNELTVVTGYSERPVSNILETFLGVQIPSTVIEQGGICQNCFIKFNEYDEHQTQADSIQTELLSLYNRISVEPMSQIKIEQEEYEESVLDIVDVETSDTAWKEKPRKILPLVVKRIEHNVLQDALESIDQKQRSMPQSKTARKPNNSKVDKDAGLIVVMIEGKKHYQCDYCGMNKFVSRSRLKSHRQIHTSERNFMCQDCGSSFKTLNCLKNHARLHSNIFYSCDICPGRFKGKHELRCHMDAVHLMRKDHVCQICGKAFSRDKTLRQHLMYHINDRNIVCEICGFATVNRPKMTRHMKSHTGERNYECNICGKRFLYSYNVTAHIKHVHFHEKRPATNEEKLLCSICGKKFPKIWKVKDHMATVHKVVEATEEGLDIKTLYIETTI